MLRADGWWRTWWWDLVILWKRIGIEPKMTMAVVWKKEELLGHLFIMDNGRIICSAKRDEQNVIEGDTISWLVGHFGHFLVAYSNDKLACVIINNIHKNGSNFDQTKCFIQPNKFLLILQTNKKMTFYFTIKLTSLLVINVSFTVLTGQLVMLAPRSIIYRNNIMKHILWKTDQQGSLYYKWPTTRERNM